MKYEYLTQLPGSSGDYNCHELGERGWELVTIHDRVAFYKRPLASKRGNTKVGRRWDGSVPDEWIMKAEDVCSKAGWSVNVKLEAAKFGNYWSAKTGKDATKLDWERTFQNWIIAAGGRSK